MLLLVSTSVVLLSFQLSLYWFSISPDDRRSARNSSDEHTIFRRDASIQSFRVQRAVNDGNSDGSSPSPSRVLPSGHLSVFSVNVTE